VKIRNIWRAKEAKIATSTTPLSFEAPSFAIFVPVSMGLSSFNFLVGSERHVCNVSESIVGLAVQGQFGVIQGRWFWYQSTAHICDSYFFPNVYTSMIFVTSYCIAWTYQKWGCDEQLRHETRHIGRSADQPKMRSDVVDVVNAETLLHQLRMVGLMQSLIYRRQLGR